MKKQAKKQAGRHHGRQKGHHKGQQYERRKESYKEQQVKKQTGKKQPGKSQNENQRDKGQRVRKQYKDTVFRMLFRDKMRLLELYNAVSGSRCTDTEALEIVTLENAIYMGMKNDLAFLVDFHLYLYEHQSTVNPNMPLRFLEYVTEEYARLTAGENLYGGRQILLPPPRFVVFYNGKRGYPERKILRLTEAFQVQENEPALELNVLVLNINEGFNTALKEQCRTLEEYMQYVNKVRKYAVTLSMEEAVDRAVDECIAAGILRNFLLANKAEVKRMSIYEYDEEATREAIRVQEYERGREEGREEGKEEGKEEGIEALILDNIESGTAREVIVEKLAKRFGLRADRAEAYYVKAEAALARGK